MQVKTFMIPVLHAEPWTAEMNAFLRSKKILHLESRFVDQPQGACWCFYVQYLDEVASSSDRERQKVDYQQLLTPAVFERFSALRVIRKRISKEENLPAFAIFTDEELAAIAKLEVVTPDSLKTIPGIGEKKIEKYGRHFYSETPK